MFFSSCLCDVKNREIVKQEADERNNRPFYFFIFKEEEEEERKENISQASLLTRFTPLFWLVRSFFFLSIAVRNEKEKNRSSSFIIQIVKHSSHDDDDDHFRPFRNTRTLQKIKKQKKN